MISYEPFWKTLEQRGLNQYRLIRYYKVSPAQLTRIRKNMYISTRVVERLCDILNCQPEDIMEVVLEEEKLLRLKRGTQ